MSLSLLFVFVFVFVFLLVRSCLLIILITCLKGHKSLRMLYAYIEKTIDAGDDQRQILGRERDFRRF